MSLKIDVNFNAEKDKWDINLAGELDMYTANELKDELNIAIEENPKDLIINMQNLDYIDSTGLGILIGVLKRLKQKQSEIYITNTKPNVKKIFSITALDKVFKMEG